VKRGRLIILLVEDDDNDIFFVRRAIAAGGAEHTLFGVHTAEEAIQYLTGQSPFKDWRKFPIPNLVLTDLNMPGMGGFGLLRWLRTNPRHAITPVIVYSSSQLEEDVRDAYSLGANSYIVKPSSVREMADILCLMYSYWSRCECPSASHAVSQ
jgi:CheY-like chemotaxis protein